MTFLSNFSLLAHCIAKAALDTGLGPAILIFYAARTWARARRGPALDLPMRGEFSKTSFRDGGQLAEIIPASLQSATSSPRKALVISTPLTISEVVERKVRRSA
jgi:hypothetical protein